MKQRKSETYFTGPRNTRFGTSLGKVAAVAALGLGVLAGPALGKDKDRDWIVEIQSSAPEAASAVSDVPDVSAPVPAPRVPRNVVRMVTDHADGESATRLCVFVPANDGDAGVLSCSGQEDVRVLEFGSALGRNVMFGEDVVDEDTLRDMIEARMAAITQRLEQVGDLRIEYLDRSDATEDLHEEMSDLREEMRELEVERRDAERERRDDLRELEMERREVERERREVTRDRVFEARNEPSVTHRIEIEFTEEELAEFEAEMEEFAIEMEAFGEEMAGLQAEVMVRLTETLGGIGDGFDEEFEQGMADFGAEMAVLGRELSRAAIENSNISGNTVLRMINDEDGDFTIVETITDDEGANRLVIHTTDPDSIEIVIVDRAEREIIHEH